jgi:hypothetical protein
VRLGDGFPDSKREIEIEFGPAGYLRTGRQSWLVAPAAIANLGVANGWECRRSARFSRTATGQVGRSLGACQNC